MPSDITHVFVPFADVQKSTIPGPDGTTHEIRLVKGLMTDETKDLDGQIVDHEWAKDAALKWHSRWGNVREQHGHNAIGKSVELSVLEAEHAHSLISKVVDPLAIIKVDEQILQGYSVGIRGPRIVKDAKAPNGRIVGGEIIEVSLVDHPANENCKVALVKAAKNGRLADADQTVIEKIADPDGSKLAEVDAEKNTVVQVTVWADGEQVSSTTTADDDDNPLDGTIAEPAAARVETAVDGDLGGSLNAVEPTGDKTVTPQITKSEEDIEMLFAKAFTEVKDLLTKGDTNAALAVIQATEVLSKAAAIVEPAVTEPIVEPRAVEPIVTTDKAASADLAKAAISEAVTKAVETAVQPLKEKVEAMEKRAAPGGPLLSGTRLLSAPEQIKGQFIKDRVDDIKKMASEHPDGAMRQGARELLAEIEKNA